MRFLHAVVLVYAAFFLSATAGAQKEAAYPTKPVRFVIPFPPGGTTEIQGRRIAERMWQRLGQPFVIDNRPGANGSIGMRITAQAPADGYTFIMANVGNWAVHPHLYKLDYDVLKDFAPVIRVATTPGIIAVHPSMPAKTVKDLVALAAQKPGELTYGSNGFGGFSHLAGELFAVMTKVKLTHVPYKGAAPVMTDLIGNQIRMTFNSAAPLMPHLKSGRLRAIATTHTARLAVLPELPTVAESGVPGYDAATWSGIGARAGTPRHVIAILNREIDAILKSQEMQDMARADASIIEGGTPEQFGAYLKSEVAKYGKLVKAANIKVEGGL